MIRFGLLLVLIAASLGPVRGQTDSGTIERYAELDFPLPAPDSYKNPYDPAQIDYQVTFTPPNGPSLSVPAFFMQPYQQTCTQNCATEKLQANGSPGWRVRFTPTVTGNWKYTATAHDVSGTRDTLQGQFSVTDSKRPGFIHPAKNQRYFGFDNGTAYFPVGANLGWSWSGGGGVFGYQRWLQELHRLGANYGRLVIDVPWFIDLEAKAPAGDYSAAQQDAWRLDTILQSAEDQGIALQIVVQWSQALATYSGPPITIPTSPARPDTRADWSSNPYSIAFSGPLNGPAQFFTNEAARTLFKRRLRYIAARWGYSTSVFAWEMIDQLDRPAAFSPDAASGWLKEMVSALRETDINQHPITAGLKDNSKSSLLDPIALDFRETRYYQRRPVEPAVDQVSGALNALTTLLPNAERPILLTEFSLNPWFEPAADDPTGVHVRETMWATALSGAGGAAASSWWDTYLFPQNLTAMFGPLAAFTRDLPWNTADLRPVPVSLVSDAPGSYQPLRITGFNNTPNTPRDPSDTVYRLTPDGLIPAVSTIPAYLYGHTYNAQLNRPQQYRITLPVDTTLTVAVKRVSERAGARLTVAVDGKMAAQLGLSAGSGATSLTVTLSAGDHTVTLDNLGDDYLQLDWLEVGAYFAPVRAVALADRKAGIFAAWFQHRDYTWENVAKSIEPKPLSFKARVAEMAPGEYRVELWDPFSGNVVGEEMATVSGSGADAGILTVTLLPLTKMAAVRAFRQQ